MIWNEDWSFALLPLNSTYEDFQNAGKRSVLLPHDWLIEDTTDLYRSGDGWYAKTLPYSAETDGGKTILLDFDGVYMDADVLVNGRVICTHRYGYTAFLVDVTGKLKTGDNEIAVHIRHQSPNSRWYSGAGIFRDVHLRRLPSHHMTPFGLTVNTAFDGESWVLSVGAEMSRAGDALPVAELWDAEGKLVRRAGMEGEGLSAAFTWTLRDIRPWSVSDPYLYTLTLRLGEQTERISVGFRETRFDPDAGFFLNGRHVKLHGVCLHHDLGALGAAFYEKAAERQLLLMKRMGVNAIRTSHNPPARRFLDLCDRLGLLVVDELFDMWEEPKTPFDNARFFPDTYRQTVAEWVRRDRCHPSVILWSIGNEIHDVFTDRGKMWTRRLMEEARLHDSVHARVTFGSNYMPWEGGQACGDILKMPGYNYAEKYYETHHRQHPDWVIYGSETGSHLQSRGIYHFPMDAKILSEEDLQCSSLLNSLTSWGTQNLPQMLCDDLLTPYSMGQFIWAGIDYIGEPTPYHTRNCYFGQADTACLPKDSFYFYQSMWTDAPMIHIGMSWDWNRGQMIDVPVMTNGAWAELFLNGRSLGKKRVDRMDAALCLPRWQVAFEPGVLLARAYDAEGSLLCEAEKRTSGEAARIALRSDRPALRAGCRDLAFIEVSALDRNGHPVENAVNRLHAEVSGPGVLMGMDNGDSTDPDPYQTDSRRLFSGQLILIVGAQDTAGEIRVRVWGSELEEASLVLPVQKDDAFSGARLPALCRPYAGEEESHIRRIDLTPLDATLLTPDRPSVRFQIQPMPLSAASIPLTLRITNAQGVDMPCAAVKREGDCVTVTARGDGKMYVRASAKNGADHARILSVQEITAEGFGPMSLDPYGLVAGELSDVRLGEITPGNEQGVSFAREGFSAVGFSHVDFGPAGSDEITLPIFALDGQRYVITLWDGHPHENGRVIDRLVYQKPSIWNVYQAETYRLPEVLFGEHALFFSMEQKVHMKGFFFTRQRRALRETCAAEAEHAYGDAFTMEEKWVRGIGNNVTLTYEGFDFLRSGDATLLLEGQTPLDSNTVMLRITGENGEEATTACPFAGSGSPSRQRFRVRVLKGRCAVSFIFLPGCQFDLGSFRFEEDDDA